MMMNQLGRKLVHAFTNGDQGGNPSYVVATSGHWLDMDRECKRIARTHACEVTHVHFDQKPGRARVRFYVGAGPISFCGHGALAATAWAVATGWADDRLTLDAGNGQLQMQVRGDNCFGFLEPAGPCRPLEMDASLRTQIAAMLGLEDFSTCDRLRVWLGGRQRAKAMIALPSPEMLATLSIQPDRRDQFCHRHEVTGIYPFVPEPGGNLAARHFPVHAGLAEDMATGNIASTIAALVCGATPKPLTIAQGGPRCAVSRLHLLPDVDGAWYVGGTCHSED
jgi:PhzF family phenazine biosynthesis protein